jgi:hypothetical protein
MLPSIISVEELKHTHSWKDVTARFPVSFYVSNGGA